jgi:glycerate-2-kinase
MLYKDLTYKPMVELIRYLDDHDFKVFLSSGGGMSFMRVVAEEIYGVANERVIGSNITFETVRITINWFSRHLFGIYQGGKAATAIPNQH